MISVLINGICGQMGRAVYAAVQAQSGAFSAIAGVDPFDCVSAYDCPVYKSLDVVKETPDVVIDFSVPATTPDILRYALDHKVPVVIGTTGLGERELKLIRSASESIPVFQTGNMSLGVNLLGRSKGFTASAERLEAAFDGRVAIFPSSDSGNTIAFATGGEPVEITLEAMRENALQLRKASGLDLRSTISRLQLAHPLPGGVLRI